MKAFKNVIRNLGLIALGVVLTLTTQTIIKNSYSTSYPELICQHFSKWSEFKGYNANGEARGHKHIKIATNLAMKASLKDEALINLYTNLSKIRAIDSINEDSWVGFALNSSDELQAYSKAIIYTRDFCKAVKK